MSDVSKPFIPQRCGHAECVQPAKYKVTNGANVWETCGEHILYALENSGSYSVVTKIDASTEIKEIRKHPTMGAMMDV